MNEFDTPRSFVDEVKIELPTTFPVAAFVEMRAAARSILISPQAKAPQWREFAGASNLIAWRFRAAVEAFERFAESWIRQGAAVGHEEIYLRECELYAMFSCGVSCLDATCYAIYALLNHPDVLGISFNDNDRDRCKPGYLLSKLQGRAEAAPIIAALTALSSSSEWRIWRTFRNRMAHRSNLPRIVYASTEDNLPPAKPVNVAATSSTDAFAADLVDVRDHLTWLASSLEGLLCATLVLTSAALARRAPVPE